MAPPLWNDSRRNQLMIIFTFEMLRDELSRSRGFKNWEHFTENHSLFEIIALSDKATEQYAEQQYSEGCQRGRDIVWQMKDKEIEQHKTNYDKMFNILNNKNSDAWDSGWNHALKWADELLQSHYNKGLPNEIKQSILIGLKHNNS